MARTEYRGPGSAFSGSVGKFMSASKRVIKKDSDQNCKNFSLPIFWALDSYPTHRK